MSSILRYIWSKGFGKGDWQQGSILYTRRYDTYYKALHIIYSHRPVCVAPEWLYNAIKATVFSSSFYTISFILFYYSLISTPDLAPSNGTAIKVQTLPRHEATIMSSQEDEASRDLGRLARSSLRRSKLVLSLGIHRR